MKLTKKKFECAVKNAQVAAAQAADQRYEEIAGKPLWNTCGGALIILTVEPESQSNEFLDRLVSSPGRRYSVTKHGNARYTLHIDGLLQYQEQTVNQAAAKAALAILNGELDLQGEVCGYLT